MPVGILKPSPLTYYGGALVLEAWRYPESFTWELKVKGLDGKVHTIVVSEEQMHLALQREFEQRQYTAPPRKPNDQGVIDYLATIAREAV